jgi:cellulose synthase/poly-beta-1,6-N-acetylglucosamine synthase-like glycosyltransferase
MWLFYFFAGLLILQGLISLRGGLRYLAYFKRETARPLSDYTPFASVIVPCRGLDQGLRANLRALYAQAYPRYEIVFVLDSANDPARTVIDEVRADATSNTIPTSIIIAGQATDCGQKVHNLRAGVGAGDPASEVFVFVDTDARPRRDWLRALVAPLADEGLGAATGYRWFVPGAGGFSSHLRAVWNASIASALGPNEQQNFCWGGSTAIRRATFTRADVLADWRGALSDDFALTRALQRARLPIRFVPQCLTAAHEDCTFGELIEFTTRQLKITRVYAPHLWRIVLVSNLLFVLVCYGGLALVFWRALGGAQFAWPLALLVAIFTLGAAKAYVRLRAVALPLAADDVRANGVTLLAHLCLWPLTSALYAYNALAAGRSRRLTWRGISYELRSPNETIVNVPAPERLENAHVER